ncbi:MAG: hypothetical protein QXR84_06005 [Candidatus Bathyarchaeia archaeon]
MLKSSLTWKNVLLIVIISLLITVHIARAQNDQGYWILETKSIQLHISETELIRINLTRIGTETLANLNIAIKIPLGIEPNVLKNGIVIAKINNQIRLSNNTYDIERRILYWNLSDVSFIENFLQIEFNVSVSENLRENRKIHFVIIIDYKINDSTLTKSFEIPIEILKPRLEPKVEFKDEDIVFIVRNIGNGTKKVQDLYLNLSIPISFNIINITITFPNSTLRKIKPMKTNENVTHIIYNMHVPTSFYINPDENILIRTKIIVGDVSKVKNQETVIMKIKIDEEEFLKQIQFKTRIEIESLNSSALSGIMQNLILNASISGNNSLKFSLTGNGPLGIELPSNLYRIEKINYFEINGIDLTHKAKLRNNAIIIDDYTILVPAKIFLNATVKIKPQYDNPKLEANISLSKDVRSKKECEEKITIFKDVKVERLFRFLPYFYDVRIDEIKPVNGSLTLHVGPNKYNLTIVNNKGTLILFREAFWPLFDNILIKAEVEDEAHLSENGNIVRYYVRVSGTQLVFTGMGIPIVIAPLIPIVTFLWIRRKSKIHPLPPPPPPPLEEEYDLG